MNYGLMLIKRGKKVGGRLMKKIHGFDTGDSIPDNAKYITSLKDVGILKHYFIVDE